MPKLTVLVGPPGSGKTTLAQTEFQEMYRISQDEMGKEKHLENYLNVLNLKNSDVPGLMPDILVDRMNFNRQQRARYLNPAKEAGYETEIIVLHENRDTCFKRITNRYDHPTIAHNDAKTANSALDTFFTQYERPTESEADHVEYRYPTPSLKVNCIVIDIDNTLSDTSHREHLLERTDGKRPNWKAFFDGMGDDPLNEWCKNLMKRYREDHIIILNSGRPDSYREVTEAWLAKNNVPYDHLFMRHRKDSRKDDLVKELIMDFEIKTRVNNIALWVDDRKQVIDKIRSRGILVLDCKGNTF